MRSRQLTAIIEKEGNGYVALCPEVDVASQGDTVGQARDNLKEALELFFEMASSEEIDSRLHDEIYITHLEVAVGQAKDSLGQRNLSAA
uniref:Predicted nuclease of the RNAse H fold, HicB family n=1 Tax=Candidatus Kentrum sp. DK TaxID=2126562 RepID=A0A450T174_9GAMM|nr:MAG: Predicted nuclease of the RNAse H fold, HicB family [Candidatus Kentron sp. DK]